MKRIFNKFIKSTKIKLSKIDEESYGKLTSVFNKWVSKHYTFKAYANKHVVRKWVKQLNLKG